MHFDKPEGVYFKHDNSFYKFWTKSTQISYFRLQAQGSFVFHETLLFEKFGGAADFKYDNNFFQILLQKHSSKAIWFQLFFSLTQNFAF